MPHFDIFELAVHKIQQHPSMHCVTTAKTVLKQVLFIGWGKTYVMGTCCVFLIHFERSHGRMFLQ